MVQQIIPQIPEIPRNVISNSCFLGMKSASQQMESLD